MGLQYKRFQKLDLDLQPFGLEIVSGQYPYFCTPRSSVIFACSGVDGIHYCFVRGFGEMVFAVNPMNAHGDNVHPVAKDFFDFLRLLCACKSEAAIEQACHMGKTEFYAFLADNPGSSDTDCLSAFLHAKLGIKPMPQPYEYIFDLQSGFDLSLIHYTSEYYDFDQGGKEGSAGWQVYFNEDFHRYRGKAHPGSELALNHSFSLDDSVFVIPSIYLCAKGIVIDLCKRILPQEESCFNEMQEKLFLLGGKTPAYLCEALSAQNPYLLSYQPSVTVNGKYLSCSSEYDCEWHPDSDAYLPEFMSHYKLDKKFGWAVFRLSFPWATVQKPQKIRAMTMKLAHRPEPLLGDFFSAHSKGERFSFTDPDTGVSHTLTVEDITQDTLASKSHAAHGFVSPSHFATLSYTLSPEPARAGLSVYDAHTGDTPYLRDDSQQSLPESSPDVMVSALALIGGAEGPSAAFSAPDAFDSRKNLHVACSALRFKETPVTWRIVFNRKRGEDPIVPLIIK